MKSDSIPTEENEARKNQGDALEQAQKHEIMGKSALPLYFEKAVCRLRSC
jgi:hypothetical protein